MIIQLKTQTETDRDLFLMTAACMTRITAEMIGQTPITFGEIPAMIVQKTLTVTLGPILGKIIIGSLIRIKCHLITAVLMIEIIAEMTVPAPTISGIALKKPIIVIDQTLEITVTDHPMTAGLAVTSTTLTGPHIIGRLQQMYTEIIPIVAPDIIVATLIIH